MGYDRWTGEERRVSLFETQLQEQADRIEKLKVESFENDIRLWGDREAELRTRRVSTNIEDRQQNPVTESDWVSGTR